jgi:hypothetical protein
MAAAGLHELLPQIEASVAGLSEAELRAAPEGKWTIADILEHLSITYVTSVKGVLARVLANGPRATRASFQQTVGALLVTRLGYLPSGRKAPEFTRPKGKPVVDVLNDIRGALPEMERGFAECKQRYGAMKIADHPILGPLNATQWRNFHCVHTRHHLKQIAGLRRKPA